jgi:hypothetical protein
MSQGGTKRLQGTFISESVANPRGSTTKSSAFPDVITPETLACSTILPFHSSPVSEFASTICGLVYLSEIAGRGPPFGFGAQQYSVGVILDEHSKGHGIAQYAVRSAVAYAFDTLMAHRVVATILNTRCRDESLALFARL